MLTQAAVEDRIVRVMDELERRTEEYDKLCQQAAESEADHKKQHALTTLALMDRKMTVQERQCRVDLTCDDRYQAMLLHAASRNSCRESLVSLREMLNALRTLAASLRQLT